MFLTQNQILITTRFIVACIITAGLPEYVTAAWYLDASVEYQFNDNQPNGDLDFDVHSDQAIESNITAGKYYQISNTTGLGLAVDITAAQHIRFTELSHVDFGVSSFVNKKLGLGHQAPVISATASVAYANSHDRHRDAWQYRFGAGLSKRLASRWQLLLNYQYENQRAKHFTDIPFAVATVGARGNAFDIKAHNFSIFVVYDISQRLAAHVDYTRREGDVVSSTHINYPVFFVSKAIAYDPAFGPDIVAYTVDAGTNILSAGLSLALNKHSSINADYEYRISHADGDLSYQNNIFQLTYLYSY
jgi:hypothetical protein